MSAPWPAIHLLCANVHAPHQRDPIETLAEMALRYDRVPPPFAERQAPHPACQRLVLRGAAGRVQPVWVSRASGVEEVGRMLRASMSCDQRICMALIDDELSAGKDAWPLVEAIWHADPDVQITIVCGDAEPDWLEALRQSHRLDQVLVVREPIRTLELTQALTSQAARWRTTMEVRSHVWRLQAELDRRLEEEARLRRKVEHDALTQLPNRVVLLERVDEILQRHRQGERTLDAVLFLDLDDFKQVNDTLGHHAGDELLLQVAERLRHSVRSVASNRGRTEIVRLGGDEFVVLLEQLQQVEDAVSVAKRVVARLAEPFQVDGRQVTTGTSVGIAFVDEHSKTGQHLLQNADAAMYRAKLSGKGQLAVFDRDMNDDRKARVEMEQALRRAIGASEFEVLLQPAYHLRSGRVVSFESLMRWRMNQHRSVPPSRFIPLAEQLGLITEIGYWALEKAVSELASSLRQPGSQMGPFSLSINLSHTQLWESDFIDRTGRLLHELGFPRQHLKLEITEEIAMRDPEETAQRLAMLHEAGFGICIDDFGAEHSSLAFFHQFPIETVKIDRSFVRTIANNRSHQAIVEAVVQLAHSLQATVVAEGLETVEQVWLLQQLGCDVGQGYYFAPPLSVREARMRLRQTLNPLDWLLANPVARSRTDPSSPAMFPLPMLNPPGLSR